MVRALYDSGVTITFDGIPSGQYEVKITKNTTDEEVFNGTYTNENEISQNKISIDIKDELEANTFYKSCVTNSLKIGQKSSQSLSVCQTVLTGIYLLNMDSHRTLNI